jgi:hypothetical protein
LDKGQQHTLEKETPIAFSALKPEVKTEPHVSQKAGTAGIATPSVMPKVQYHRPARLFA